MSGTGTKYGSHALFFYESTANEECPAAGIIFFTAMENNPNLAQDTTANAPMQQTVYVNVDRKSNGVGTAGFVLALIAFLLCWVPVLDFILWFLGALLSFIGVFKAPRGLAIAGLVISFIGIIVIVAVVGAATAFS